MTRREREFIAALRRLTVDGVTPTYDRIAEAIGLASKSGVARMVEQLTAKGVLRHRDRRHGHLVIEEDERAAFRLSRLPDDQLRVLRSRIDEILVERAAPPNVTRPPTRLRAVS